jgi:sialidase-1
MTKFAFADWMPWRSTSRMRRRARQVTRRLGLHGGLGPRLEPLEDRRLLAASAQVLARQIFYNNSVFDGNDPRATSADDAAIAVDKRALLAGQTASFENYTSYRSGINGVMVDIADLRGMPTASDFLFHIGNTNDSTSWSAAPAPIGIAVREGAGVNGSSRVTITWADGSIKRTWLRVTVLPTDKTGLSSADVFYFGNAVGESGDSPGSAGVSSADQSATRNSTYSDNSRAPITERVDYNRDGLVNSSDELIARNNATTPGTALRLIQPSPSTGPQLGPSNSAVGSGLDGAAVNPPAFADFVSAAVVDRKVFYNYSRFDGDNAAATAGDDAAIATDKQALLPGQTASFANYTSYSAGINGVMVDIAGLPGPVTADDFVFRIGRSADPSQWVAAPAPLSISVRQGAGSNGAARVTIIWPDGWIRDTWLRVTVKATPRTGLAQDDVFYFGNVRGETGNNPADTIVSSSDQVAVRIHPATIGSPTNVTSPYDFNRDGLVNSSDELIARLNATSWTIVPLFSAPTEATTVATEGMLPMLFNSGDGGYDVAFSPTLVRTSRGTLLALAEGRLGKNDVSSRALIMRRSTDNGVSWSPISTIFNLGPYSPFMVHNPAAVVDDVTGQVFIVFTQNTSTVWVTTSNDDGLTWSLARNITSSVKVTAGNNPNPAAFPSTPWGWYATGPTHGIQIKNGTYAGRLVITADHRYTADNSGTSWTHVIYSDDHGATWHLGGGLDPSYDVNADSNEASIVETSTGGLYLSIRLQDNTRVRGASFSSDGGMTWSNLTLASALTATQVSGSLLRVNANTVLFAAPDNYDNANVRHAMTIWVSTDDMQTWSKRRVVYYGYAGYSDMALAGPDTVLLAFGAGQADADSGTSIGLTRLNLRWLLSDPSAPQFDWFFNEQAPGTAANIRGVTLRDNSPWDNRARAMASSPTDAPVYVPGANAGDAALRLTEGSDVVEMTSAANTALQFQAFDSFTIEFVMRTTDNAGVILASVTNDRNWSMRIVDGKVQFMADDQVNQSVITSTAAINDGQWHRIALVRNRLSRTLSLYIDGALAADPVADRTPIMKNYYLAPITMGAMADGSEQLAFDIDRLRVTRAALNPSNFLNVNTVGPGPTPAPVYPADAPSSLSGLKFWLPAFDPAHFFSDDVFAGPMIPDPVVGTAVRSAYDASSNGYRVTTPGDSREQLYAEDSVVGASWSNVAQSSAAGNQWIVRDSNGTQANNFDFVQNTGVFTISAFIKPGFNPGGAYMSLFDTAENSTGNPGFSLTLGNNGNLQMSISGTDGLVRLNASSPDGLIKQGKWYHIVVVGQGAGAPVRFYVTDAAQSLVVGYISSTGMMGPDGNYATDAAHDLNIGARANTGAAAFNGQMVDEAIYNRALTAAEIQQLFDFTKK